MSTNQRKVQCGGNEEKNMNEIKLEFHEMFKDFEKSIADIIAANNRITNDHIEKLNRGNDVDRKRFHKRNT